MAIELIAKIKPINNGTFKMVDACDVEMANGQDLETYLRNLPASGESFLTEEERELLNQLPNKFDDAKIELDPITGKNILKFYSDETEVKQLELPFSLEIEERLTDIEEQLLEHARKLEELLYVPISISSLSLSKSVMEIGDVLSGLVVTWAYNKEDILSQKFNGLEVGIDDREYTETEDITSNKTYTLEVNDGKNTTTKSATVKFLTGKYYGATQEGVYDSDFIKGLTKTLVENKNGNFTVNCGENEFIYFCIPTRFGTPRFSVGGFEGGFFKVDTIEFTNDFGYSENYDIYRSDNSSLGNTTVNVG